jgi:hypothetical protein
MTLKTWREVTLLDDGGIALTTDEHVLVVEALALAKALCLDMEADKHGDDDRLVEVRLLALVEQIEPMGFRS